MNASAPPAPSVRCVCLAQYVCPTCCEARGYVYKYKLGGPTAYTLPRRAHLPASINPRPFVQPPRPMLVRSRPQGEV